jgi:hypothetical protein
MMHSGEVVLPDGRIIWGRVSAHYDGNWWSGTGAYEIDEESVELEWIVGKDGKEGELTADDMNEEIVDFIDGDNLAGPRVCFLWELAVDMLLLKTGEPYD